MNIKKVEKITHYELNVTAFELIIIQAALECLLSSDKKKSDLDLSKINSLINDIKSSIQ